MYEICHCQLIWRLPKVGKKILKRRPYYLCISWRVKEKSSNVMENLWNPQKDSQLDEDGHLFICTGGDGCSGFREERIAWKDSFPYQRRGWEGTVALSGLRRLFLRRELCGRAEKAQGLGVNGLNNSIGWQGTKHKTKQRFRYQGSFLCVFSPDVFWVAPDKYRKISIPAAVSLAVLRSDNDEDKSFSYLVLDCKMITPHNALQSQSQTMFSDIWESIDV